MRFPNAVETTTGKPCNEIPQVYIGLTTCHNYVSMNMFKTDKHLIGGVDPLCKLLM